MSEAKLKFRIYYHDQPPYTGDPFNAPIWGVLVIIEPDKDSGRRVISNGDYYGWDVNEQRWYPYDWAGLMDYLQRPGPKRVLIGRLISNDEWNVVFSRAAYNDPDFPPKTTGGKAKSKIR